MDPGEEVELYYLLKNVGGVDIQNLTGIILSSSPYLNIANGSAYFGSVLIDSLVRNSIPFRIQAVSNAPQGTFADIDLILSENSGDIDTIRIKVIIGKKDYLVWDPDRNNSSGPIIHSILQNLGYVGDYINTQFYSFECLKNYKSLFICTGVAYENYVLFKDCYEVKKVVDFINDDGNVYLEGGECWAFDPFVMLGFNFNPYFGIRPISDGYTNMGPIEGINNTFTQGMEFRYNGENFYLDVIDSTETGFRIFHDRDDDYYCGVANITNNYKSVGVSFELSGLVDNDSSTKADLLDSIMHFFGINLVGIEDLKNSQSAIRNPKLEVYPNPFKKRLDIRYTIHDTGLRNQSVSLSIYDVSGRVVKSFNLESCIMNHESSIIWFGDDDEGRKLPAGVYFVKFDGSGFNKVEKVVLLR
ncbi:MAG: T9SS type A sorting domain-containing protein [candidate division WOR-3 bacterium]